MPSLIQQRTPHDCAICCMAMLTGRTYEDVMTIAGSDFDPERGMRNEHAMLDRLGFKYTFENGHAVGDMVAMHRAYALSPDFFRGFAWGRRALLSVPSLNYPGQWHMVFYDGHTLFDPSPGRTYARFEDLLPEEIIIFREGGA